MEKDEIQFKILEKIEEEEVIIENSNSIIKENFKRIEIECKDLMDKLIKDSIKEEELEKLSKKLSLIGDTFNRSLEDMMNFGLNDKDLFLQSMVSQSLISKLAHKIQKKRYKNNEEKFQQKIVIEQDTIKNLSDMLMKKIRETNSKINKDKNTLLKATEELKGQSKKLGEESEKVKENVITISSLVFTAFTFIQLNFVAFQNSKDYTIIDRIILFSGINLFLLIGIYGILSMIKSLLNNAYNDKEEALFKKIKWSFLSLTVIFILALGSKWKFGENPKIKELENNLVEKNKEILSLNNKIAILKSDLIKIAEMKNELDSKENELEKKMLSIKSDFEEMEKKNIMYLTQLNSMHFEISQSKLYAENKRDKEKEEIEKKEVLDKIINKM